MTMTVTKQVRIECNGCGERCAYGAMTEAFANKTAFHLGWWRGADDLTVDLCPNCQHKRMLTAGGPLPPNALKQFA